jgi:hypothetical protein
MHSTTRERSVHVKSKQQLLIQYSPSVNMNQDEGEIDDNDDDTYYTNFHRILGSASTSSSTSTSSYESYKLDYNVLSVAAMTLALIMMVEYVRHRLDHYVYLAATHATHPKPLFRSVLEGVYAECTVVDRQYCLLLLVIVLFVFFVFVC